MTVRRLFVAVLCLALFAASGGVRGSLAAEPRLAIVEQGEATANIALGRHAWWDAFLDELNLLGHVEGETITIARYTAGGKSDEGFAELAAAVVEAAPDVIMARGIRAVTALKDATSTIPIVGVATFPDDLVDPAREPGNVTGINATSGVELYQKHLQFLKDVVPSAVRVGWLGPRAYWEGPVGLSSREGARRLGLNLVPLIIDPPTGAGTIRDSLAALSDLDALYISASPDMTPHRELIADRARAVGLPTIALQRGYARAGLLMSYGPDFPAQYRRAAGYVDQILAGSDPATLRVEPPDKYELVVNLKTAAALGLTLPQTVLIYATELIE